MITKKILIGILVMGVVIYFLLQEPQAKPPQNVCGDEICQPAEKKNEDCPKDCNEQRIAGLKIVPPPDGGMYIGQTEAFGKETDALEKAIGKKAALKFVISGENFATSIAPLIGQEDPGEDRLDFNVERANKLWDDGYIFIVGAYETSIGGEFRVVDRLLRGEFDDEMHKLAVKFKEFRKPMFFHTTREPNGAASEYQGGFGPKGDKTIGWAEGEYLKGNKKTAFASFIPPKPPTGAPKLYDGLGDPEFCDGLERLVAAQRYYYDFFTRREGIDFLTFDAMGWWVPDQISYNEEFPDRCMNYTKFMEKLDGYYDWVSINWYLIPNTPAGESENQLTGVYLDRLNNFMKVVKAVAPGKPVMLTEFGFCDDDDALKVREGLNALIKSHPEINAFILWFDDNMLPHSEEEISFLCQIESGTPEGKAFREIVKDNSDYFHSCVYFSDGSTMPHCRDRQ